MHLPGSHPPGLLRYSHPDGVDTLSRGAGITFWGLVLGVGAGLAGELFPHHLPAIQPYRVAAFVSTAVLLRGVWLLTPRDAAASYSAARWGLRALVSVGLCGVALEVIVAVGVGSSYAGTLSTAALAAAAADVLGRLLFLRHLGGLARRLPDPSLAKRFAALVPAYGLALIASAGVDAARPLPVVRHLGLPSAVALGVVTIVLLRHLARLGRGLMIQTDYAQGIWARTHGGTRVAPPVDAQTKMKVA
jgi:hypothetical protein